MAVGFESLLLVMMVVGVAVVSVVPGFVALLRKPRHCPNSRLQHTKRSFHIFGWVCVEVWPEVQVRLTFVLVILASKEPRAREHDK